MARNAEKRSCVTCKYGIPLHQQEYEVIYYIELVKTIRTPYHCANDNIKECQCGFELGKLWEPKEGAK